MVLIYTTKWPSPLVQSNNIIQYFFQILIAKRINLAWITFRKRIVVCFFLLFCFVFSLRLQNTMFITTMCIICKQYNQVIVWNVSLRLYRGVHPYLLLRSKKGKGGFSHCYFFKPKLGVDSKGNEKYKGMTLTSPSCWIHY